MRKILDYSIALNTNIYPKEAKHENSETILFLERAKYTFEEIPKMLSYEIMEDVFKISRNQIESHKEAINHKIGIVRHANN